MNYAEIIKCDYKSCLNLINTSECVPCDRATE